MHIVDSHEFYDLYRGDKDFRLGRILTSKYNYKYTMLVPDVSSPADRSFFNTKKYPLAEIGDMPDMMEVKLIPAKLVYFNKENISLGGFFQFSPSYVNTIKKLKPDLIFENPYTTLTPRSYSTGLASKLNKIPMVYIDAGDVPVKGFIKKVFNRIESRVVKNARAIITYNKMGAKRFVEEYGYPPSRIRIIPKPVDTRQFSPAISGSDIRKQLGIDDKFVVAYPGRLSRNKGARYLLAAAKKMNLSSLDKDIHFMFMGGNISSRDSEEIMRLSNKYRLKNVHFTGKIKHDQMPFYQAAADLIIYPDVTNLPGFSTVLAETMATGKPIVMGIKGYESATPVEHEKNGLIIEARNRNQIVESILRLKDDAGLRTKLANNARAFAENHMDWDIVAHKYHKLFMKAIS